MTSTLPSGRTRATPGVVAWLAAALAAVLLGAALPAPAATSQPARAAAGAPTAAALPNVVEIVVDDMNDFSCAEAATYLPQSSRWLRDQGTCFENASVNDPVCCPARAEILSGRLPHNTGVRRQVDAKRFDYRHSVQHVVGRLGVDTDAVGKLFNGIPLGDLYAVDDAGHASGSFRTGFDSYSLWTRYLYTKYRLKQSDGRTFDPHTHTTLETGRLSRQFISGEIAAGRPFFSYDAYFAPHEQVRGGLGRSRFPTPTARDAHAPVPRFHYRPERDASDKLPAFAKPKHDRAFFRDFQAARVRALLDVDHQVALTFQLLQDEGVLDDTVVLLVSDNGYLTGQHNWNGKAVPYADAVDVPMLAFGPGRFAAGAVDDRLVSLLDLTPTIYDVYGVSHPGYPLDGHSLLGEHRRRYMAYEYTTENDALVRAESGPTTGRLPSWDAITIGDEKYVEWKRRGGRVFAREFYSDPGEERNLLHYPGEAPRRRHLARFVRLLHAAEVCAGTAPQAAHPCS